MMAVAEKPVSKDWRLFEDITKAMSESLPVLKPATEIAPSAGFRIAGMKIPRQPHRYSGRTSMHADISVHELKPAEDPDAPLAFSMEGYGGIPPSSLISRFWSPGWNSMQAVNKFQSEIGGHLHGGDPGRRLIEPNSDGNISYFTEAPPAFVPGVDKLLIPLYHIFGSEELSALSPAIAGRAPQPYLGMNPDDIKSLQIAEKEIIDIVINEQSFSFPVKLIATLPRGTAGLPIGLPGLDGIILPAQGRVNVKKLAAAP
jgi:NADH-quinone oxidoreductase subunit G